MQRLSKTCCKVLSQAAGFNGQRFDVRNNALPDDHNVGAHLATNVPKKLG